jgi:hypothetical protein
MEADAKAVETDAEAETVTVSGNDTEAITEAEAVTDTEARTEAEAGTDTEARTEAALLQGTSRRRERDWNDNRNLTCTVHLQLRATYLHNLGKLRLFKKKPQIFPV